MADAKPKPVKWLPRGVREGRVPPRDPKGQRTGYTTGACAAAAAKAATRGLVRGGTLASIDTTLPNRRVVTFALERFVIADGMALASVIKDGGDDPDCTHGAEIVAEVRLAGEPGVRLAGGPGVATVTMAGLGLDVGSPAINPVPRKNITDMVLEELVDPSIGAVVTISVPEGLEMARETLNERLGLVGGISILGTTGIVRPYSTAAFKASVVQAIDLAAAAGLSEVVVTTGGKSEEFAMALLPHLPPAAFVQVGDFVGVGLKTAARRRLARVTVVGMIGKLSKMADGQMQTHAAGSSVNTDLLARLAVERGADDALANQIRASETARGALELCAAAGIDGLPTGVCQGVVEHGARHVAGALDVQCYMVEFAGELAGGFPRARPGE